jgi:hypothetical protein
VLHTMCGATVASHEGSQSCQDDQLPYVDDEQSVGVVEGTGELRTPERRHRKNTDECMMNSNDQNTMLQDLLYMFLPATAGPKKVMFGSNPRNDDSMSGRRRKLPLIRRTLIRDGTLPRITLRVAGHPVLRGKTGPAATRSWHRH